MPCHLRQTGGCAICAAHPELQLIAVGTGRCVWVGFTWFHRTSTTKLTFIEEAIPPSLSSSKIRFGASSVSSSAAMPWPPGSFSTARGAKTGEAANFRPLGTQGLAQEEPRSRSAQHQRGDSENTDFQRHRRASCLSLVW